MRRRVREWDGVAVLSVVIALYYGAFGVSAPVMTIYLQALGADYAHIALILASTAVVTLSASFVWGRILDRLGRRRPIIILGMTGLAVTYVALSQVSDAGAAWLVRLGEAAAGAAYNTASLALVGDLLAERGQRGLRMGTYRGIGSLAFAVGALSGGTLASLGSLRVVFDLSAALYLLGALAALVVRESRTHPTARHPVDAAPRAVPPQRRVGPWFWLPWQQRSLSMGLPVLFVAGVFLFMLAWHAQLSLWPNYLASLGYSTALISALWAGAAALEMPAMRLAGSWSDRVGRETVLGTGGAGAAVVILGYGVLGRWAPAMVVLQSLRGLFYGGYLSNAMTYAVEAGDEEMRGRNSGLYNTTAGAAQLAGLLLGGNLAQAAGFVVLFSTCAGIAALGSVCFWALRASAAGRAVPGRERSPG